MSSGRVNVDVGGDWGDPLTADKVRETATEMSELLVVMMDHVQNVRGPEEVPTQVMSVLTSLFVSFAVMFKIDPDEAAEQLFVTVPNTMREHYERVAKIERAPRAQKGPL